MHGIKFFVSVFFCFIVLDSLGQVANFEGVMNALGDRDYDNAYAELKKIDSTSINAYDKATLFYYYADYYNGIDKHGLAYKNVIQSKKIFKSLNKRSDVSDCNMLAIVILYHQNELKDSDEIVQALIDEELEYIEGVNETKKIAKLYKTVGDNFVASFRRNEALEYYKKCLEITDDTQLIANIYANTATAYLHSEPSIIDSALYYSELAQDVYLNLEDKEPLAFNYNNRSQIFKELKQYDKAIDLLLKADSLPLTRNINKIKVGFYRNLTELYGLIKNYEKQAYYLNKQLEIRDIINDNSQNIAISEIEEKFQNERLRANNLEIESKRRQERNIGLGITGGLVLITIIVFLYFNNKKKKQEIEIQNEVIAKEQLKTKLKDQELKSVDAMIEGQEKERLNIANELHDELGSLMSTIKMHFESIKTDKSDEIYHKTNQLIENAYKKIRNISHTKNSGVMANKGLVKAVKDLANTFTITDKIAINVHENVSDQRIANSIELTLFRIVQELINNTLKHAKAKHLEIYLTTDNDNLNIMIEDDGIGFDEAEVVKQKNGIGLLNIEKRIEQLGGKMVIESYKGKGTSVILDIPL